MGVVYLAKDPVLGRTVALKMLTEDNEELRERFAREARSAAALDHTNIVTIYDVGEDNGQPFIAMKYLDGETMAELIRRRAPITLGRKLELMGELCAGLGYAHRSGIVHRDIKPANLMITTDGTLKILDFGIARVTAEASHSGLTRLGTLIGSPHYMSPEQAEGLPADERSDIFSVGLVFYELLSFTRAFPGDLSHVVLHNIVHKEPRPIRELVPDIDSELERIVTKGVVKDPPRRYQTLAELASDLERVQERLDGTEQSVVVIDRDSQASQGKSKTGGSGARSFRNWEEIDGRRKALIESHLAEASAHLDAGRYEEAVDQCEKVLVISPEEPRALELLHRAHSAVDGRQVQQWLTEAQTLISRGAITEAELLVGQAIQLQPDSAEGQAAVAGLKERRREQERAAERARSVRAALTKALANMEAGAFEAAMRSASEALAFDPAKEEAQQVIRQAREAIEERNSRIAHDRRAGEVVDRARQSIAEHDFEGALTMLRAFSPPHQAVSAVVAEAERAKAEFEERRSEIRATQERKQPLADEPSHRPQEAGRAGPEDDERRKRLTEIDLQTEFRRQPKPEREEPTFVAPVRRPRRERDWEGQQATVEEDRQPWFRTLAITGLQAAVRKPAIGVAVGVLLLGGLVAVGWALWRPTSGAGSARSASETSNRPAVDYAPVLADAEAQSARGELLSAIAKARTIPTGAPQYARAQDLVGRIRAAAATRATAGRQTAEAAGAATQDAFLDADRQLQQAHAMPDAEAAVKLFEEARQSFVRAASAGLTLDQLMQRARDAIRRANIKDAIAYAAQALSRDSNYQPAIVFLNDQRQKAARATREARQRATTEGASEENSAEFKNARRLESGADGFSSTPLETPKAVDAYGDAKAEYDKVYASAHDANVVAGALRRADQRLKSRDAAGARMEIETVQAKDPNNRSLPDLLKRLTDLKGELAKEAEAATAAAEAKRQAADFLKRSLAMDDSQAIGLLEQASNLDSTNAEIRNELERRRKSLAGAGRSGGGARGDSGSGNAGRAGGPPALSPTEAVQSVLRDFAATYKGTRNNEDWTYTSPAVVKVVNATEAIALWNVTVVDTNAQGAKSRDKRKYEFVLKQSAQGWKIETFSYKGPW